MATLRIKKGDTVRVISGRDKNKEGKVLSVNAEAGTVVVEGVNMCKRHIRAGRRGAESGIISAEGPIPASKVVYLHKGQPTRVGFYVDENGKKVRYAKKAKEAIDD